MSESVQLVTSDDLLHRPRDDRRYELVAGRLVPMSPVFYRHGRLVTRLLLLLERHLEEHNLGVAMTEVGFKLASNPDTVRAPDVAVVRKDRVPSVAGRGFVDGPPDLAAEILSPDDRPQAVRDKIDEYLTRGVMLVLVVDADKRTVTTYRRLMEPIIATGDGEIDLGDVVPGFRCAVREIFDKL